MVIMMLNTTTIPPQDQGLSSTALTPVASAGCPDDLSPPEFLGINTRWGSSQKLGSYFGTPILVPLNIRCRNTIYNQKDSKC